jgi:hypothetical protein
VQHNIQQSRVNLHIAVIFDEAQFAELIHKSIQLFNSSEKRHTADVRALEDSQFHIADEELLAKDPLAFIYIATILARRLNYANRALIELKRQLHAGEPQSVIAETIAEIECNLVYAGYPFNPLSRN